MPDLYVDNRYKQLYVAAVDLASTVSTSSSNTLRVGLSDLGELPGQSTWYIRSIQFKVQGYQDEAGFSPDTRIRHCGGMMNRDITDVMAEIDDYQDFAGWPAKGVYSDMIVLNNPQHNWFSYTKLWKPSENLTLSREQDIVWNSKNIAGNDMLFYNSLYIHAERGE